MTEPAVWTLVEWEADAGDVGELFVAGDERVVVFAGKATRR